MAVAMSWCGWTIWGSWVKNSCNLCFFTKKTRKAEDTCRWYEIMQSPNIWEDKLKEVNNANGVMKRNHAVSNKNLQISRETRSPQFLVHHVRPSVLSTLHHNNIKQHQGFKHRVGASHQLVQDSTFYAWELWVAFSRHWWPQWTAGTRRVVCSQPGWVSLEPLRSAADVASHIEKPLMNSTGEPSLEGKRWDPKSGTSHDSCG